MGDGEKEDIKETLRVLSDITEIKVTMARMEGALHTTPCPHLCDHMAKQSKDVSKIYERIEKHNEDHHSPKTIRENWVALAVILCTVVTFLSPFISKWLNSK